MITPAFFVATDWRLYGVTLQFQNESGDWEDYSVPSNSIVRHCVTTLSGAAITAVVSEDAGEITGTGFEVIMPRAVTAVIDNVDQAAKWEIWVEDSDTNIYEAWDTRKIDIKRTAIGV